MYDQLFDRKVSFSVFFSFFSQFVVERRRGSRSLLPANLMPCILLGGSTPLRLVVSCQSKDGRPTRLLHEAFKV